MSSLLNSLSDIKTAYTAENMASNFPNMLNIYRDKAVNEYNKFKIPLNQSISKIAKENNLNDDQIQRIVEEVNNEIYLMKYAQLKQSPERDVVFDLASLKDIKNFDESKTAESKVTESGVSNLEKKASWEDENDGDKLNFLNYSENEMGSLKPETIKEMDDILAEKLAVELNELNNEYKTAVLELAGNIYTIADALVKYDRSYKDSQEIFNSICKEADINKDHQSFIKKAVEQKVSQLKEAGKVPSNYVFSVELVDNKEEDKFSLGKYSMSKIAKETKSNSSIPTIITDDGQIIKSVGTLVNMAKKINAQKQKVNTLGEKKNKINEAFKK